MKKVLVAFVSVVALAAAFAIMATHGADWQHDAWRDFYVAATSAVLVATATMALRGYVTFVVGSVCVSVLGIMAGIRFVDGSDIALNGRLSAVVADAAILLVLAIGMPMATALISRRREWRADNEWRGHVHKRHGRCRGCRAR